MASFAFALVAAALMYGHAAAESPQSVEIAPGVMMPKVLLGTGYMPPPNNTPSPIPVPPNCTTLGCQTWWTNATAKPNVLAWLASGARGIDAAFVYNDQEAIASAIAQSGIRREEIFVLTKIPGVMNYSTAMALLEADYAQLGGRPLDVVVSHWCSANSQHVLPPGFECTKEHIQETWRALEDFHTAGKVRAIGVSNYCLRDMRNLLSSARVKPHVHQIERHPYFRQSAMENFCREHGIHLQAYAPLADADRQGGAGPKAHALFKDEKIVAIASRHNVSAAQVVLQWQLQNGHSVTPRIMTANLEHVRQNVAVLDGKLKLTSDDMATLNNLPQAPKCWPTAGTCPEQEEEEITLV